MSTMSDSDPRWFAPPPARTAAFSSARRPGSVLRVSRTRIVAGEVDELPRERGDAGEVAQEVRARCARR